MFQVYSWATPNGHKVHIMLEECGFPYEVHPIHIGEGDQFKPEFLKISPNNKIPAIIDEDGPGGAPYAMMESGAILIYLAKKAGRFLPSEADDPRGYYTVLQWLMFQMGHVGPMLGQAHHFRAYAPEKIPYAVDRYTNEAGRLYGVINKRLGESAYLGGPEYTIADIATFPWLRSYERQGQKLEDYPHLKKWFEEIAARPAVERGVKTLADRRRSGGISEKEREVMFGAAQYAKR